MSEIERIRAAAAHPENWKSVKRPPARRGPEPLRSLLTSWPGAQPRQLLARPAAEAAETEEPRYGK